MDEMLLHLHLQSVSLHTCSDLGLNSLCLHRVDVFKFLNKEEKSSLGGLSQEARAALDVAIVEVQFCRLQG